jgi:MFS family permease
VLHWLRPHERLTDDEVSRGLTMVVYDGICSQVMATLVGGAFLVAFALNVGASNKVIGFLAAVGPLSQILQLPSVLLIDRMRVRKLLTIVTALPSRLVWVGIALLPWIAPPEWRLPLFLLGLGVSAALGTVSGAAWNPWMRDLIPESAMSDVFSRRMAIATGVSAALGLVAGMVADQAGDVLEPVRIYALIFFVGALWGLVGLWFLFRTPEPRMPDVHPRPIRDILSAPLRDRNFRELVRFLGSWNFAVNIAAPFVTVYMLRRLEFSLAAVVGLAVLSQTANALSLRVWGRLSDRFSNKSVLGATGGAFLISTTLWPVTAMVHGEAMVYGLAALIHILAGIAAAGVTLCSSTIALKAAPRGEASSYLATNALFSGVAATVAPIIAGFLADWFTDRRLTIELRWVSRAPGGTTHAFPALDLQGLDFLFVLSFLVGLYSMHRLLAVREEGDVKPEVVVSEFYAEVRRTVRSVSTIGGLRRLTAFPFAVLLTLAPERRRRRRRGERPAPRDGEPARRASDSPPSSRSTPESFPAPAPGSHAGAGSTPFP